MFIGFLGGMIWSFLDVLSRSTSHAAGCFLPFPFFSIKILHYGY